MKMNEEPLECSITCNRRSWRLVVDPALTKAARKIYKYDDRPQPERVVPREDPRTRKPPKFDLPMDLPVPKFKVDENSRLSRELGIINLNETVTPDELKRACSNYGTVVKTRVLYHPTTKVPLLLGRVVFESLKSAQNFYGRFQNSQFLGRTIKLFRDYNGTKLHQLYKETIEKDKKSCPPEDRSQSGSSGNKPVDEVDPRIYRLNAGVNVDTAATEAVAPTGLRSYPTVQKLAQSCVPVVAPSVQPSGEPRFQYAQYPTQAPPGSLPSPTFGNAARTAIPPAPVPLVPAVAPPPPTWHRTGSPPVPWQQQQPQFWQTAPPPSIRSTLAPPAIPPPPPAQSAIPALAGLTNLPCPRAVATGGPARPPFLPFQRPPITPVPFPPTPAAAGANVAAGASAKMVNYGTLRGMEAVTPAPVGTMMGGNSFGTSFLNGLVQSNQTPLNVSQLPGWGGADMNAFMLRWKAATEYANFAAMPGGLNGPGEPLVRVAAMASQANDSVPFGGAAKFATEALFNGPELTGISRRRSEPNRHDFDPEAKRPKLSSGDVGSVIANHANRSRCRHKTCCPKYKARLAAASEQPKTNAVETSEKEEAKSQTGSVKVELESSPEAAALNSEQPPRSSLSPFSSDEESESPPHEATVEKAENDDAPITIKHPVAPINSDSEELDDGLEVKCFANMGASCTAAGSYCSDDSDNSMYSCSLSIRSSSSGKRRCAQLGIMDERISGNSSQGVESMCISPASSNSSVGAAIVQRQDIEAASSSKAPLGNVQSSAGHRTHSRLYDVTTTTAMSSNPSATFSCNLGPSTSTSFCDVKEGSTRSSYGAPLDSNSAASFKSTSAENLASAKVQVWLDAIINRCYTDMSEELSAAIRRDLVRRFLDFALCNFSKWMASAPRKEVPSNHDDGSSNCNCSSPRVACEDRRTWANANDVLDNVRLRLPEMPSFKRKILPRTPSSSPPFSDEDADGESGSSREPKTSTEAAPKRGTPVCSDFEDELWSPTSDTLASTRSSDISRAEDSSNASVTVEAKAADGELCRTSVEPKRRTRSKNAVQTKSLVERKGRKRGRKGASVVKKPRRPRKASNVLFINLDEEDFHTGSDTTVERSEELKHSPLKPSTVCWDGCMVIEGKYSPRQHDHGYSLGGFTIGQSASNRDSSTCAALNVCESTRGYSAKRKEPNEKVEPECFFSLRSAKDEAAIVHSVNSASLTYEDLAYLKTASAFFLSSIAEMPMLNLHWSRSTEQMLLRMISRRRTEIYDHAAHRSGGARTEGFYRLTKKEKNLQAIRVFQKIASESDAVVKAPQAQEVRAQTRAMQRLLFTNYGIETDSDWLKYDQMQTRKKLVRFDISKIHGWGLFAMEDIGPDEMIIEYVGQKIRMAVAERREEIYEKRGIGSSYLFRIDNEWVIDATNHGNMARFINHSCAPNCYAKVISVNSQKRIVIYSKQNIRRGEEITYDYKFPREDEKIPCNCRSFNCRGSLN
uniref:[histone H3]-lysine(4) N-trimethyltransferase n=1 Tax=Trichuris muris TaxID=70415 RepID=A0A5S6QIL3_TRIMR